MFRRFDAKFFLLFVLTLHALDDQEKRALEALAGDFTKRPSNWVGTPSCSWKGLTCSDGAVVGLNLTSSDVSGTISDDLAGLHRLRVLDLSGHTNLRGMIPTTLNGMTTLEVVDLSATALNGSLDSYTFSAMPGLTELRLGQTNVYGDFERLDVPGGLRYLDVANTYITGTLAASVLRRMPVLRILDVSSNLLSGPIPENVGLLLPHLEQFLGGANSFSGEIPESVCAMERLRVFAFPSNELTGYPRCIGEALKNIEYFDLAHNQLEHVATPSLDGLLYRTNLTYVDVSFNRGLTGQLVLTNTSRFDTLRFSSCSFGGTLEALYAGTVQYLFLEDNNFHGPLPDIRPGASGQTYVVDLSYNNFSGPIPDSYGHIDGLRKLSLRFNYLNGSLPASLVSHKSMLSLDVSINALSGALPECGPDSALLYLDIGSNRFSGNIVPISTCRTLEDVIFANNTALSVDQASFDALGAGLPRLQSVDFSYTDLCANPVISPTGFRLLNAFVAHGTDLETLDFLCAVPAIVSIRAGATRVTRLGVCMGSMFNLEVLELFDLSLLLPAPPDVQPILALPPTLSNLILRNVNLVQFPPALASLGYVCVVSEPNATTCSVPTYLGSVLASLDVSANPSLSFFQSDTGSARSPPFMLEAGSENRWLQYTGPAVMPVMEKLTTFDVSNTFFPDIPLTFLIPPLSVLILEGTSGLAIDKLMDQRDSQLVFAGTVDPIFYLGRNENFRCERLLLKGRKSSVVIAEPAQYAWKRCQCVSGYYGSVVALGEDSEVGCNECAGLSSRRNLPNDMCGVQGRLVVVPGWYPMINASTPKSRSVHAVTDMRPCPLPGVCTPRAAAQCFYDGHYGMLNCYDNSSEPLNGDWSFNWLCADGYEDRMCLRCADDRFQTSDYHCKSCPKMNWVFWVFICASIAVAVLIFIFLQGFGLLVVIGQAFVVLLLVLTSEGEAWVMTAIVVVLLLYSVAQVDSGDALVKSLLFYLQALGAVAPSGMFVLVERFDFLQGLHFSNLRLEGVECFGSVTRSPVFRVAFDLALPMVIITLSCVVVAAGAVVRRTPPMRRAIRVYRRILRRIRTSVTPRSILDQMLTEDVPDTVTVLQNLAVASANSECESMASDFELSFKGAKYLPSIHSSGGWSDEGPRETGAAASYDNAPNVRFVRALAAEIFQSGFFVLYAVYFEEVRRLFMIIAPCSGGYMQGYYGWVSCDDPMYDEMWWLAIGGLGIYFLGVSVAITVSVLSAGALIRAGRRGQASRWVGFLFEGYRESAFWFEIVWTWRRLLLAAALTLLPHDSSLGPFLTLSILASAAAMQFVLRPFILTLENALELVSLLSLMITYGMAQLLSSGGLESSREAMMWILLVGNLLVSLSFVVAMGRGYISQLWTVVGEWATQAAPSYFGWVFGHEREREHVPEQDHEFKHEHHDSTSSLGDYFSPDRADVIALRREVQTLRLRLAFAESRAML